MINTNLYPISLDVAMSPIEYIPEFYDALTPLLIFLIIIVALLIFVFIYINKKK